MKAWSKLCMAFLALAVMAAPASAAVTINEIRIDMGGTDNDEYVELAGNPGESLDGMTYLVLGDTGSGTIEAVVDLTGNTINGSGYFLIAESTFTIGPAPDLVTNINFENSDNVTHLLVTGFTGVNGQDTDADDDCVLDASPPWTSIVDLIALVEEANPPTGTECHYGDFGAAPNPTAVGPDGTFVPAHIFRLPDSTGPWQIGEFSLDFATDTPGAENKDVTAEDGVTFASAGVVDLLLDLTGGGTNTPITFRVLAALGAGEGTLHDAGVGGQDPIVGPFPYDLIGDLEYNPPSGTYTGVVQVDFDVEDNLAQLSDPATQYVCIQGDEVVISEIMHFPSGDPAVEAVFEYVEAYNYSLSSVDLWGLAGDIFTDAVPNNLSGKSIGASSFAIIAPSTTTANDEAFACDWKLTGASDIIRVDTDTWQTIQRSSSLVGLFEDTGSGPGLLDAVWVAHSVASQGWPAFRTFPDGGGIDDVGHAVAVLKALLFGAPLTPVLNDDGFPWVILGTDTGQDAEALQVSESGLYTGSPGWVPSRNEGYVPPVTGCPTGECCLPDGTCEVTFELECTDILCGVWSSGGDCSAPGCSPLTTGACCTDAGDCFEITSCECAQIGGTYQGDATTCGLGTCPVNIGVVVNEIDYDNPGTDNSEFIELLGPPGTDLTGWSIELYNGNGGVLYTTIPLSGTIPADRFYLIGPTGMPDVDLTFALGTDNMQNGGPDGLVLIDNTSTIIELISYEGTFAATDGTAVGQNLPDIGVSDAGAFGSLQKILNGGTWTATPAAKTPGASNATFDSTCRTVAEIKAFGAGAGVRLCDATVTTTLDMSGNTAFKTFFVQDNSGTAGEARGIQINGSNAEIDAVLTALGGVADFDTIQVEGTVDEFDQFLIENGDIPLALVEITTNGTEPTPVSVDVLDMQDGSLRAEELTSALVQIDCVWFDAAGGTFAGSTNYFISNGDGTAQIRIATGDLDLVGTTIPSGPQNIKGLITQFGNTYSIRPRSLADITSCATPPTGACCAAALTCSIENFGDCVATAGSTYQGDGTTCTPNPCVQQGACCLPTGSCAIMGEADCLAEGSFDWTSLLDQPLGCDVKVCTQTASVLINEVRIDSFAANDNEYFEIFGPGDLLLTGLTYLVIGDGTTADGTIEAVVSLDGLRIPADGYFLAAEDTFDTVLFGNVVDLDLGGSGLNFENGDNVTHLLVADFSGISGDDLDTNGDCVLDSTPWTIELDRIALVEEDNPPAGTECHYGDFLAVPPTAIGPDGAFVPGHVYRDPDAGPWAIGIFDPLGDTDTPGATNIVAGPCVATGVRSCADHGGTECCIDVSSLTDPRICAITKLEIDVDDASGFSGGVTVDCVNAGNLDASVSGTSTAGTTVTVTFSPALPDEDTCTVTLDCGASVCVKHLAGDVDGDGTTTTGDASIIKPHFNHGTCDGGGHGNDDDARRDVNCDGTVTTSDFSQTKPLFNNAAPACP